MIRLSVLLLGGVCLAALNVAAQNAAPVVTNPIAGFDVYAGAASRSIDLTSVFQDPDMTPAVRLGTVFGDIDIALYERQKPITVGNFLQYVDQGRYFKFDPTTNQQASSFIHRSAAGFVIQGGGFIGTVNPDHPERALVTAVATFPKIQNEPGISNTRGTIAMAKLSGDPNSATSQWFINLADNGHFNDSNGNDVGLDVQNGGFTAFARVLGNGMDIADRIANLPVLNAGSVSSQLPVRDFVTGSSYIAVSNLVSLPAIDRIDSVHAPLTFTASSDNAGVAEAKVSVANLLVTGKGVGTAHITVTATDVDGATVSQTFTVNALSAPGRLVNISTRLQVRTDEGVLIGGFIVSGDAPKRVLVRAIGPSLASTTVTNPLLNPQLELHDASGAIVASSDNWADANKQNIVDTGIPPNAGNESAILTTLPSSSSGTSYTAVVRGANNTTGTALVEVYDLDSGAGSTILNISTRGFIGTSNDQVMIGGFIVGGTESKRILIRALGQSLANQGVSGALPDPTLELHDANGAIVESNNDWQSSPEASDIQASGIPPSNAKEAAILRTLTPAAYTAVVHTNDNNSGVASVEVYQLP